MPRGKGIYDDEDRDGPTGGPVVQKDEGGDDATATRANTPDVDESSEEATA